jgi:hypothetical protein
MSDVKEIIKLVKNDQNTKNELSSRLSLIQNLSTGEKAELTTKLMVDKVIYEEAIVIMGEGIKEAEIEIEALEHKNSLLEKDLNVRDKEKVNAAYDTKKFELQNDGKGNSRVMRRLNNILARAQALPEK